MTLSKQALAELREIFRKNRGEEFARAFSNEDLNYIGLFVMEVTVQGLKLRMKKARLETEERNKDLRE